MSAQSRSRLTASPGGSRTATASAAQPAVHLTAVGRTVSQLRVPDKTNEITGSAALLAPFGLTGTVVTADALRAAPRASTRNG